MGLRVNGADWGAVKRRVSARGHFSNSLIHNDFVFFVNVSFRTSHPRVAKMAHNGQGTAAT